VTNALARVLATAPDAKVRDSPRALQLSKALFERTKSPEVGQTYAMALAEMATARGSRRARLRAQ
jgi:hypothetical protein